MSFSGRKIKEFTKFHISFCDAPHFAQTSTGVPQTFCSTFTKQQHTLSKIRQETRGKILFLTLAFLAFMNMMGARDLPVSLRQPEVPHRRENDVTLLEFNTKATSSSAARPMFRRAALCAVHHR